MGAKAAAVPEREDAGRHTGRGAPQPPSGTLDTHQIRAGSGAASIKLMGHLQQAIPEGGSKSALDLNQAWFAHSSILRSLLFGTAELGRQNDCGWKSRNHVARKFMPQTLAARLNRRALIFRNCRHQRSSLAPETFIQIRRNEMTKISSALLTALFAAGLSVSALAATDPAKADAKATKEKAEGDYKAAKAKIKGDYEAAEAECKKLSGEEKSQCKKDAKAKEKTAKKEAKATYEKEKADAKAMK